MIIPIIRTAPSELPEYEATNLLDKCDWYLRRPRVNDIRRTTFLGHRRTLQRSMQRVVTLRCDGLNVADAILLQKWKHNRTRLRPQGFYGEHTLLYHSFQRSHTPDMEVGSQVFGTVPGTFPVKPTFTRSTSTSGGEVKATFMADDGYMYTLADDVPRYGAGAFGLKGLVSESSQKNRVYNNYAKSGTHLWTVGGGTVTISFRRDDKPLIANEGFVQSSHANMANGSAIKFELTSGEVGTTVNQYITVWVKGQGYAQLEIFENSAAWSSIGATGYHLLRGGWQKLEKAITRTNSSYNLRFVIDPGVQGNEIHLGPVQLEDGLTPTSFIYNWSTSSSNSTRNVDSLLYNIELPFRHMTMFIAFKMPPTPSEAVSKWLFHKDQGGGERFGLRFRPSDKNFQFQRSNTSGSYSVFYTTSKSEGDDILIAIAYDLGDGRIYEDGSKEYTRAPIILEQATNNGLYLTDAETNMAGIDSTISFIRIDNYKYSDTEIAAMSAAWVNDDERIWQMFFEGRDFEIDDISLRINEGDTEDFLGNVTLVEVESEPSGTTEAP